jgi:hypothetical protein
MEVKQIESVAPKSLMVNENNNIVVNGKSKFGENSFEWQKSSAILSSIHFFPPCYITRCATRLSVNRWDIIVARGPGMAHLLKRSSLDIQGLRSSIVG